MVRVGLWRSLAAVALCHSLAKPGVANVAIGEQPMTFVTSAAASDKEPIWLVLPLLLDVQPVLLTLDATRHVPAQIQSFCREHGVDVTRCFGAVQHVLDEVVNFQRFCKTSAAESALPGFAVAKNVLREGGDAGSAMWLQNDPEDVAIDFCGFAKAKVGGQGAEECAEALGKALRLSFDWMLALTSCDQQGASSGGVTAAALESPSIVERVAEVEEMIAALQSSSASGSEDVSLSSAEEGNVEDASSSLSEGSESVQEIAETGEAGDANGDSSIRLLSDSIETEVAGADSGRCDAAYATGEGGAVGHEEPTLASSQSWKVGAALVLALSVAYLVIDLMIYVVRYTACSLEAPKQLVNVLLHDALLLIRGGPRSTLPSSDELKKPAPRGAKVSPAAQPRGPQPRSKHANAAASKPKAVADALHQASPSFTCVAMLLMASSHAPVPHESFSPAPASFLQLKPPAASFVQDSSTAIDAIEQKCRLEVSAVQCIQKAWKSSQRKRASPRAAFPSRSFLGKWDSSAPIFRLLQLKSAQDAPPRGDQTTTSLRRLVPKTLPPL
jgi:hypothetical protein